MQGFYLSNFTYIKPFFLHKTLTSSKKYITMICTLQYLNCFFGNFNPIWGVKLSRRDWQHLFPEKVIQESVIYQDILQQGRQQEALALIRCEQLQKLMRKLAANVR